MRKIILYTLFFVLICFIIPIILTERQNKVQENENTQENKNQYVYKNYGTVRLLHTETDEVEELSMDEYLYRSCISRNAS